MNTEALEAFATKDAARRAAAPKWRPPESSDFHLPRLPRGRWVIGVDQSLSACGAVLVGGGRSKDGSPVFSVEQAWKIVTDAPDDKGFEASLRRATELSKRFRDFLVHAWLHGVDGVLELAHETPPPLRLARIKSPESSLLASLALRIAADASTGVILGDMVTAQNHKNFICGNRLAEKAEHHAALKQLGVDLGIENFDLIKNEATRDALSIALMQFTRPPLEIR